MNKNISFNSELSFDQGAYRILYYRYKVFLFPLLILLVSVILASTVIFPQFKEISGGADEVKTLKENLSVSKSNLVLFSTLGDLDIDNKLNIALNAMPSEKDFTGILNAVSVSAAKSGVFLNDFSFQVGELSTTSAKLSKQPSLQVSLSLLGGVEENRRFLKELSKALPLSEVTKVTIDNNLSKITVLFYYRPFPALKYDSNKQIKILSQKDLELINKLSSWNNPVGESPVFSQVSSGSARSNPFE